MKFTKTHFLVIIKADIEINSFEISYNLSKDKSDL